MSRVLLLATTTGYQTRAFGEAADRLGIELVFATDRCHVIDDPWSDAAIPIRFHEPRKSVASIVAAASVRPIDGILVVGDRPTVIAAATASALGLPGHPVDAVKIARDKRKTRERLRSAGLPTPAFTAVSVAADLDQVMPEVTFPCVVKPIALSASRGVIRADNGREFRAAFERIRRLLLAPDIRAERTRLHDTVLVETFIEGREFALEGVLHKGSLHTFAVFDKPDPLDGPFFEETIYTTPSRASAAEQAAIRGAIGEAAAAIGLWHGPIHAECRVNASGVYVLEIAARPIGGLCARVLRLAKMDPNGVVPNPAEAGSTPVELSDAAGSAPGELTDAAGSAPVELADAAGSTPAKLAYAAGSTPAGRPPTVRGPAVIPYEEFLLRHALGESPRGWQRESLAAGVMMIPIPRRGIYRDVVGLEEARDVASIEEIRITAKPDQVLVPLPEGASYLGFIFARAVSAAVVDEALRDAHRRLEFTIDPQLRVVQSAHG